MRCLELYSGIGGFAVAASRCGWEIALAIDINQRAAQVYRHNFDHALEVRTLESVPAREFAKLEADLWWMSPPCQPFTRRGRLRDLCDPRCESLSVLLKRVDEIRPQHLVMENVPGFQSSLAGEALRAVLQQAGYCWKEAIVCPTDLGVPNRRKRYYLAASRQAPAATVLGQRQDFTVASILDDRPDEGLFVSHDLLRDYGVAMHCVESGNAAAVTACFTSAYGKSPVRSGSYLIGRSGVRRFSAKEILRLLGFPASFTLPVDLSPRAAWKLIGNSLSVFVVTDLLYSLTTPAMSRPHDSL